MADVDEEIKALQKERESGVSAAGAADGAEEGAGAADGKGADSTARDEADRVALTGAGAYDREIYGGGGDKFAG